MQTGRVTIGNTPTLIIESPLDCGGCTVIINNNSEDSIFIDGASVSAVTGFELSKKQIVTLAAAPGLKLYGITESGTVDICYIATRR